MAWYRPLQRKDNRWDYTCTNSAGTFPLGYCHEYKPLTPDAGIFPPSICEKENARMEPFKHKYHSCGHSTAGGAMNCYREHQLDQMLKFDAGEGSKTQQQCGICQKWTTGIALIAGEHWMHWDLCDKHRTREHVEELWKKEPEE